MANKKYVRIPAKDLPDLFYLPNDINSPEDGGKNVYFARYRVVSEDGRLSSKWSQKFEIDSQVNRTSPTQVPSELIKLNSSEFSITKDSGSPKTLTVTWNVDRLLANKKMFVKRFHVYVRFHSNTTETQDPWVFLEETLSARSSTVIPAGKNKVDIAVLVPTYRGLNAPRTLTVSPATLFAESVLILKEDETI